VEKGLEKGAENVVEKQLERAAVKGMEERAAKEAAEAAAKKEADEAATVISAEEGARVSRSKKSARSQYLGRTPSKNTRTGNEVRERMRKEGLLRTDPETGADVFFDGKTWRPVDTPETHMGHHPIDAVDHWNDELRYTGAKSEEVRQWMLDSDNYRFEWGPENSARGGATSSRYLPPTKK